MRRKCDTRMDFEEKNPQAPGKSDSEQRQCSQALIKEHMLEPISVYTKIYLYIYKMCYFGGEMIRSATRPCHGNLMAVYITWNRPCPAPANQQAQKTQRTL